MADATQWERLDLPLLEKVAELEGDIGQRVENQTELCEALGDGWDERLVGASVGRLVAAEYLAAVDGSSMTDDYWLSITLDQRGRRAVGLCSGDDIATTLLDVLDERIATEEDPDERARWRKLRDGAANLGQGVLTGVLVETLKRGVAF